jgi:hypothetical protein
MLIASPMGLLSSPRLDLPPLRPHLANADIHRLAAPLVFVAAPPVRAADLLVRAAALLACVADLLASDATRGIARWMDPQSVVVNTPATAPWVYLPFMTIARLALPAIKVPGLRHPGMPIANGATGLGLVHSATLGPLALRRMTMTPGRARAEGFVPRRVVDPPAPVVIVAHPDLDRIRQHARHWRHPVPEARFTIGGHLPGRSLVVGASSPTPLLTRRKV